VNAEHTKTQNSDTHLHSEIYQHCMSCRNYRNTGLNYLAVWIAALTHTVTGSMRRLCGLHQVTLYHMATCYITTVPMYFRVTKNSRCGIPTHVTTHIHAFSSGWWKFAEFLGELHASVCHVVGRQVSPKHQ
jgi:hypothetical protein